MDTLLQIPNKTNQATFTRHPASYSLDEFVILRVENVLYRLLKSVLTSKSEFFKDMFSSEFSIIIKDKKEGTSDSTPIVFEQVGRLDFDHLLSLITTGPANTSWSAHEWTAVLDLADRWQMSEVTQEALNFLKLKGSPCLKIIVGRRFGDELFKSGLVDFCSRETPITQSEAKEIGFEVAIECATVRETLWKRKYSELWKNNGYYSQPSLYTEIAKLHATSYVEELFSSGILTVT